MAVREKYTLLWPCKGGRKKTTVKGKPDFVFGGDLAVLASGISAVFAGTPGQDGTAVEQINQTVENSGVVDASTTHPKKGSAIVCTFRDENNDIHRYRFPEPLAANLADDGKGNDVLLQAAGDVLATRLGEITGYSMTFVYGWLDKAKQSA